MSSYRLETLLVHAGESPEKGTGASVPPVFQSTSFAQDTAEDLEQIFSGRKFGYIYTRNGNPTVTALELKMTQLESGMGSVATSSGMAAITATAMTLAGEGDEIVAGRSLYGGTYGLFSRTLPQYGIRTHFVDAADASAYRDALTSKTRFIFTETMGNPRLDVPDLREIARVAKEASIPFVVDSTVTTPALIKPRDFGADIVVHSTTKYLNGHGNSVGGVLVDCGMFSWENHPGFEELSTRYGQFAFLARLREGVFQDFGLCLSPQNAFLTLMGMQTLCLRMNKHCQNAEVLVNAFKDHPAVAELRYPGLSGSEEYSLAKAQFGGKFGAIFTLRLGTKERCFHFINNLSLALNLANIGDTKTLVLHPASTICQQFEPEEKQCIGVTEDLLRVCVGIEDEEDLLEDFQKALDAI